MKVAERIDDTPPGMVILVKLLHPENAEAPRVSKPSGSVRVVSEVHPLNAYCPMDLTPSGIEMNERVVQLLNEVLLMSVTLFAAQ
jgi:hypothetical protein